MPRRLPGCRFERHAHGAGNLLASSTLSVCASMPGKGARGARVGRPIAIFVQMPRLLAQHAQMRNATRGVATRDPLIFFSRPYLAASKSLLRYLSVHLCPERARARICTLNFLAAIPIWQPRSLPSLRRRLLPCASLRNYACSYACLRVRPAWHRARPTATLWRLAPGV